MDDPALLLLDLIKDNWTATNPAAANIDWLLEPPEKTRTNAQLCVLRPGSDQFFTAAQRRTIERAIDIGANPTRHVREPLTTIIAVKATGTANRQASLQTRWNMLEEVRRIVKTYGTNVQGVETAGINVKAYLMEEWTHDDFKSFDPNFAVSRSIIVAVYFK